MLCADIDRFAVDAIALNAALNGVVLSATGQNLLAEPLQPVDCVLVGDLFYEKSLAATTLALLRRHQARGDTVLVGDPGRSYLPRTSLPRWRSTKCP